MHIGSMLESTIDANIEEDKEQTGHLEENSAFSLNNETPGELSQPEQRERRKTFVVKPKIEPRDTKLSLQRKQLLLSAIDVHGKSSVTTKCHGKVQPGSTPNSLVHKTPNSGSGLAKHGVKPSTKIRCTAACKTTPVCPLTPKLFRNYACVDSKTERMVSGLEGWLRKRGKPMIFNKLKKVSTSFDQVESSSDDVYLPCEAISEYDDFKENEVAENDFDPLGNRRDKSLISGALEDLRNLIQMGFPSQDSEEWLSAIRASCRNITSEPLYWECLALLRNGKPMTSDFGRSYSQQVEELERKFNSLDIASPAPSSRRQSRILKEIDSNNVVPSTVINFAVKEDEKVFVVTPVRRCQRQRALSSLESARSSYFDISPEIREHSVFKPNHSLDF